MKEILAGYACSIKIPILSGILSVESWMSQGLSINQSINQSAAVGLVLRHGLFDMYALACCSPVTTLCRFQRSVAEVN